MTVDFLPSPYMPLAISFMGLSTGYMIMGGKQLFKYPPNEPSVVRAMGIWAAATPALIQFVSAIIIFVGMTWFGVFKTKPYAYFLIVAFLSYAAHWLAMGWTRFALADERLEGWMGIPLCLVSVLGVWVMAGAGDVAVAIAFALLACIYVADIVYGFQPKPWAERMQGLAQFVTAWWLMYLVWAIVLNYTGTMHAWI